MQIDNIFLEKDVFNTKELIKTSYVLGNDLKCKEQGLVWEKEEKYVYLS